ncbi:hypothetical protein NQ317_002026 [Molorchus minor]|uniref:Uncharacterized protein n=1 Tax=Molorchus minor TaxID=1323400 RepID=A0ABQ9JPV2_9CUCU|nr:hypothetical protein NQ317_002026 [Molorchus minor]
MYYAPKTQDFLKEAPQCNSLLHKIVLIMGYFGGCRDIDDRDSVIVVNISENKTGAPKKITIVDEKDSSASPLLRRYMSLHPAGVEIFFNQLEKMCLKNPQQNRNVFRIARLVFLYGKRLSSSHFRYCPSRCRSNNDQLKEARKVENVYDGGGIFGGRALN